MNGKLIIVTIAICVLLVSGIEGYRRRSEDHEKKLFDGLGGAVKYELEDFVASLEEDFNNFMKWIDSL